MWIVRQNNLLLTSMGDNAIWYKPNNRYVVSNYELDELMYRSPKTVFNWSNFAPYERRYGGQDLNGKTVCIYRHSAWGDQLIASALPRYLKALYPEATIHMYCHPKVLSLWKANTFVSGSAIPLPIPFDAVKHVYDYHIFLEGMLEADSERDQENCYDSMFSFCGFRDVPPHYKRPHIFPLPSDYEFFNSLNMPSKFILYHVAPNNFNRCYPVDKGVALVKRMVKTFGVPVVAIGSFERKYAHYVDLFSGIPNVINVVGKCRDFRDVIPFIERSSLLICPDSSIMHMAACFPHVPVISLWGLFDPSDRIKYYPNSYPIFNKDVCPVAPCRCHDFELPLTDCVNAVNVVNKTDVSWCPVLDSISVDDIIRVIVDRQLLNDGHGSNEIHMQNDGKKVGV